MPDLKERLIVALDVDSFKQAEGLVGLLYPTVKIFKVGSQLFTACGPQAVRMIAEKGAKVFLDLKFYDIPHTVFSAASAATGLAIFMFTVHISGGRKMLEEAVAGAEKRAKELNIQMPFIIGVTRLTSQECGEDLKKDVFAAAQEAKAAGLSGVVCSVKEALMIRRELGKDFMIVTPGIRPKDYPADDQSRVASPEEAVKAGADFIVVGRPILKADNPKAAAEKILEKI
ncbi:MAG: orotidine-5'-phosphate decarboxylase [Candidatus Omnitrophota bacterium]|nr:orotidine-5'-phosphate decarboxylase [Candidatus Omnitrophota bacterium]